MNKLIRGILDFRKNVLPGRRELFARLATGQSPDVLFITCSDSRVAPNWFASTDPGDLFVIRNVGNIVPPCQPGNKGDTSVAAAIEFSLGTLGISDIVVCGHSGCGAIRALSNGIEKLPSSGLQSWLEIAKPSSQTSSKLEFSKVLSSEDQLSQSNVLQQLEHIRTYPSVKERLEKKTLQVHGWWFDIAQGGINVFDETSRKFILIDEKVGTRILESRKK